VIEINNLERLAQSEIESEGNPTTLVVIFGAGKVALPPNG
jgi:hypothetical protein